MKTQLNLDLMWGGYYASLSSDDNKVSVFRMLDFNRDAYHAALFAEEFTDTPNLEQLKDLSLFIGHVPIDTRSLLHNDDLQMIGHQELSHSDLEGYIYYLEAHEQLQNTKERGISSYSRLSTLLLKVSEVQPSAPVAMIEMLIKAIEQAQATVDAGEATVKEAKNDWSI